MGGYFFNGSHKVLPWIDCKTVRIFAYSSTREQSNEAENRERDWGETLKIRFFYVFFLWACEARALCARKTLTARFTDFFTDFEKKTDCFAVYTLETYNAHNPGNKDVSYRSS